MRKKYVLLLVLLLSLVLPVATQGTGSLEDTGRITLDSEAFYVNYLSAEFFANHDRALAYHIEIYNAFPVGRSGHAVFLSYY